MYGQKKKNEKKNVLICPGSVLSKLDNDRLDVNLVLLLKLYHISSDFWRYKRIVYKDLLKAGYKTTFLVNLKSVKNPNTSA